MIEVKGIFKSFGTKDNRQQVLKGVDLSIADGSFTVILGASGSGKSTLLNIISGLERPDEGEVLYDGENICALDERALTEFRKDNVGFVFQQYFLLPHLTVENNVKMGADLAGNKDFSDILAAVGLADKKNKRPSQLSGGEQQRVSIARAVSKNPKYLFMDEPTGALDEETGRQVLDYIIRLQRERKITVIMVTHNQNIAETANCIVRVKSGKIASVESNAQPKSAFEIGW